MEIGNLIGNRASLFASDIDANSRELCETVKKSGFLIIGAAGSIGQAVTKEIFKRNPRVLHVVDISENNLVELVRDLRSSLGYITGDFQTYAIGCDGLEYDALVRENKSKYDYVLNLSALKHVRSESDPFTLMRLINTNIFSSVNAVRKASEFGARKYFCVSTDKAANPVNMMGASKRIMELFMQRESEKIPVSMARFANVAFSDGSLLYGFSQRLNKSQPISAPSDVLRYFVTPEESGQLCLLSTIFGKNLDVFFPKLSDSLHLIKFSNIAVSYLAQRGYEPYECDSEDEARERIADLPAKGYWPCYFFESDTTGEKDHEEFFTSEEVLDWTRFNSLGVIKNESSFNEALLAQFESNFESLRQRSNWNKMDLVELFHDLLPDFAHLEKGKYLDQRM